MWLWRRMERISWKDKISNEEVLERVGVKRDLMDNYVKKEKEDLDRACPERGWVAKRGIRRTNGRKQN